MSDSIPVIAAAFSAVSAGAAASSTYINRRTASRATHALVWPEISIGSPPLTAFQDVSVRLHNDGLGIAYDVSWSVGSLAEAAPDDWRNDREGARDRHHLVARALRPGAITPQGSGFHTIGFDDPEDIYWILVRWTDADGVRYELSEQSNREMRNEPIKLRGVGLLRAQLWREPRDW